MYLVMDVGNVIGSRCMAHGSLLVAWLQVRSLDQVLGAIGDWGLGPGLVSQALSHDSDACAMALEPFTFDHRLID